MPKLSDEQVIQKLIEGRNFKRLYYELKDKFDDAQDEIKELKTEVVDLKAYFSSIVETQSARITELETMVYGRKPKGGKRSSTPKDIPKVPTP